MQQLEKAFSAICTGFESVRSLLCRILSSKAPDPVFITEVSALYLLIPGRELPKIEVSNCTGSCCRLVLVKFAT